MTVYIYRHMKSWQLTNLLSEIELQLEKAPLAAAITPYSHAVITPFHQSTK